MVTTALSFLPNYPKMSNYARLRSTAAIYGSVSVLSQKFSVPKTHQIRSIILFLPKAVCAFNTKEILIIFFTIRCPIFAHIFSMQQFSASFALKTPNMKMFIQCHQCLSILKLGFIDFTARIQNCPNPKKLKILNFEN